MIIQVQFFDGIEMIIQRTNVLQPTKYSPVARHWLGEDTSLAAMLTCLLWATYLNARSNPPGPKKSWTGRVHGNFIAIHIAVSQTHKSQFLDKSRDAIANDARSCNCEYDYISETVQAVAKVTTEFEIWIWSRMRPTEWCHFLWLWGTVTAGDR